MNIGYLDEYGEFVRFDPAAVFKKIRFYCLSRLKNQINRINHRYICRLINRHIMPEPTGPWGLDVFGPRKCLRCGEVRSINMVINVDTWKALNNEANLFIEYSKLPMVWDNAKC